jgi:hypothetical protein
VGVKGLAGVPWERRDVELSTKIEYFFEQLTKLESLNDREDAMSIFYFVLSAAQVCRKRPRNRTIKCQKRPTETVVPHGDLLGAGMSKET